MASAKIISLAIRTAAKPIATYLKSQATQHETFRNICISIAQRMHRTEAHMRMNLLNEPAKNIKPLNDTRAIQNGANSIAEGFLFAVAAGLILGESYRGSRSTAKRRDSVDDALDELREEVHGLKTMLQEVTAAKDTGQTAPPQGLDSTLAFQQDDAIRSAQRVAEGNEPVRPATTAQAQASPSAPERSEGTINSGAPVGANKSETRLSEEYAAASPLEQEGLQALRLYSVLTAPVMWSRPAFISNRPGILLAPRPLDWQNSRIPNVALRNAQPLWKPSFHPMSALYSAQSWPAAIS